MSETDYVIWALEEFQREIDTGLKRFKRLIREYEKSTKKGGDTNGESRKETTTL